MLKFLTLLTMISLSLANISCKITEEEEPLPAPSPVETSPTTEKPSLQETQEKTVVARIDGSPIYKEDLKGRPLDSVIMNEIFYQEGLRKGIDEEVEDKVEEFKRRLVTGSVTSDYFKSNPNREAVTDEEIETFYRDNLIKYQSIRIQEIAVGDQKLAEEIIDRAKKGEDLGEIASELSVRSSIITIKPEELEKMYQNAFESAEKGSVSKVIMQGDKYRVLKIIEINDIPLGKIKNAIMHGVQSQKKAQALRDYQDQIIKENKINVEIVAD